LGLTIGLDGNVLLSGSFENTADFGSSTLISSGEDDIVVAKMDTEGNWLWAERAGGIGSDGSGGITTDLFGNHWITGGFSDTANFGPFTLTSYGEYDIVATKFITHPLKDLIITNLEWSNTDPVIDETLNLTVTIQNIGDTEITEQFYVDLYYDLIEPPEILFFGDDFEMIDDDLAPGESIEISFFDLSSSIETVWHSYVQVDADNLVDESDETNNICGPDLINWHPAGSPAPDTSSDISEIPLETKLLCNYPNPFNPETTIKFGLAINEYVSISIYNLKGQKVKSLLSENLNAGYHSIIWDGEDNNGTKVSSGTYYYQLKVNGKTQAAKKCLLLK